MLPRRGRRSPAWRLAGSYAFYAGSIALLGWAARADSYWVLGCVSVLVLVGGWFLNAALRASRDRPGERHGGAMVAIGAVLVVGLVLTGWWYFGHLPSVWGFLGVTTSYFSLGQAVTEARASTRGAPWRGVVLLGGCGLGLLAGLILIRSSTLAAVLALVGSVLASPIGLSLLTEDVVARLAPRSRRGRSRGGAALAVLATLAVVGLVGGLCWLYLLGAKGPYLVAVALLAVLLVGAIAANTTTDVVLVVIMVAVVWALAPRTEPVPAYLTPVAGSSAWVALGDSFMSGEGASRYFAGTNTQDVNQCRRAPSAYPALLASMEDPQSLLFLACSGAKVTNLAEVAQYRGEPIDDSAESGLSQLDALAAAQGATAFEVSLVILGIGGNDANFGSIAQSCVGPGDCTELGQRWLDNLDDSARRLRGGYDELRRRLGPDVAVVVVPYPIPLRESGCSWSVLSDSEHRFLHGYTEELNEVIRVEAGVAGFHYVDGVASAFTDRQLRLCDGEAGKAGVNFLAVNPVEGRVNPRNWFHNSLHPNERGHGVLAEVLASWLDGGGAEQNVASTPAAPHEVRSLADIMGVETAASCDRPGSALAASEGCQGDEGTWTLAQVRALLRRVGPAVFVTLTGGWLGWLWILSTWRSKRPGQTH